ncbi:MAG: response regulator [Deltaproteobacteria bacterium]
MARVLVIDDVLESVNLITLVLQADGHECKAVSTPAQAFLLMEAKPFDLVITDQNMPGMTGEAVLERVTAQWPKTAQLMLTADPRIREGEGRTYPVMHKPFRLPVLRAAVKDLLEGRKPH